LKASKTVGHGTIDCNGTVEKHTNCNYKYENYPVARIATKRWARILWEKTACFIASKATSLMPRHPKPVPYVVDYFAIKPEAYTTLRAKLLAK
jgi:hypothetical protein